MSSVFDKLPNKKTITVPAKPPAWRDRRGAAQAYPKQKALEGTGKGAALARWRAEGGAVGKPKTPTELIVAFRQRTSLALEIMDTVLIRYQEGDESVSAGEALKAAEMVLTRAWGTAPQVVRHEVADRDHTLALDPTTLNATQLTQLAALIATQTSTPTEHEEDSPANGQGSPEPT